MAEARRPHRESTQGRSHYAANDGHFVHSVTIEKDQQASGGGSAPSGKACGSEGNNLKKEAVLKKNDSRIKTRRDQVDAQKNVDLGIGDGGRSEKT